jgi:hypothetical protein
MLYRFEINRPWVVSPGASRVYLASAVLTLLFYAGRAGISAALFVTSATWSNLPVTIELPLRLFLVLGMFGTAVLWVAMVYYWYSFDSYSDGTKGLWLLVILTLGPIGTLVYYFAVYRPQTRSAFAPNNRLRSTPVL